MSIKLLYLADSYQKASPAKITGVSQAGKQTAVTLDQTVFYPQGGGQPADHGTIRGPHGHLEVVNVTYNQSNPQHIGKLIGTLKQNELVKLELDWPRRYHHMQLHSAGHILHEAIMATTYGIEPVEGMHGIGGQTYIKYKGIIDRTLAPDIEEKSNEIIRDHRTISTRFVTLQELKKEASWIPPNLPQNKPLRVMQIEGFSPIPDGGTQVKSTDEINHLTVLDIDYEPGHSIVRYTLNDKNTVKNTSAPASITLQEFSKQLETVVNTKGKISQVTTLIPKLSPPDRIEAGKLLNAAKQKLNKPTTDYRLPTTDSWLDVTIPGSTPPIGHLHPISQAIDEIERIFTKIGFTRVRYPEVDWDWYAFGSLNFPKGHPARDDWETFFVASPTDPQKGPMLLTPHTSNGQVREMERLGTPPIRMINIAKCYRRQQDVTHTAMFHQFEGLVVDQGINIQHLKGTIDFFARHFYGPKSVSRLRPFHFQFTEPSFEVDFICTMCEGKGCKFCKSGWHEVGGAGMVHPNVLRAGKIDPQKYTGFAFGWGVERTYTLKPGLKLDDIRLLYSNNLEFLSQF